MSKKEVHPVVSFLAALFWVFLFFIVYVVYFYESDEVPSSKEKVELTMEEAITILNEKNDTKPQENIIDRAEPRPITFMEKKRDAIKNVLLNHYQMNIRKNELCDGKKICTENIYVQTSNEDEYRDIWVNFGYKSIEVYTNDKVQPQDYITTCSAVMIGVTGADEELVENTIIQAFNDASKTTLGVKGNFLGVELSIVPDYRGLLKCKFYKY